MSYHLLQHLRCSRDVASLAARDSTAVSKSRQRNQPATKNRNSASNSIFPVAAPVEDVVVAADAFVYYYQLHNNNDDALYDADTNTTSSDAYIYYNNRAM